PPVPPLPSAPNPHAAPASAAAPSAPAPPPAAAPAPAVSSAAPGARTPGMPYRLIARTTETTWMRVRTEDGRTSEETIPANEIREWVSNGPFVITIGNAGGVSLELNGRPVPRLGASGAVITRFVLPSDAQGSSCRGWVSVCAKGSDARRNPWLAVSAPSWTPIDP